jgi:hypothetical protein
MKTKFLLLVSGSLIVAALSLHSRPSPQLDLSKVDFTKECLTMSDPSDRLNFFHETVVTAFISVNGKFGGGRIEAIHLSNAHLATHGGASGYEVHGEWKDGTPQHQDTRYRLEEGWGLVGDVDQKEATVYSFAWSPLLKAKGSEHGDGALGGNPKANLAKRAADLFEAYAIQQLRKGDALVRWERPEFMRAVGAVRAEAVCLKCHEVKQGDLLGAFTYRFAKISTDEAAKEDQQAAENHIQLPPRETPAVLEGNRKGLSLEAIARTLPENEHLENNGRKKWYAVNNVRMQLLHAGMVTEEMLEEQRKARSNALGSVVSSLESVDKAK